MTSRSGFLLDEGERVEALQRAAGKEAIHRILLSIKELEGDCQSGQQEQLQMRANSD
jgi:hypothetical protein